MSWLTRQDDTASFGSMIPTNANAFVRHGDNIFIFQLKIVAAQCEEMGRTWPFDAIARWPCNPGAWATLISVSGHHIQRGSLCSLIKTRVWIQGEGRGSHGKGSLCNQLNWIVKGLCQTLSYGFCYFPIMNALIIHQLYPELPQAHFSNFSIFLVHFLVLNIWSASSSCC